jgi:uncharacterized protein YfaS (alpha-2-macroglobulin family)
MLNNKMNKRSSLLILCSILAVAVVFGSFADRLQPASKPQHKKALVPIKPVPLVFPKGATYDDMWKKVDSLQSKGLYKSALEAVTLIFNTADKDNNAPQVVKAVIHQLKFNTYLVEDDYVIAIDKLNKIAESASFPLRPMVHSLIAEVYWGYYQSNRYKFMNRSQTVDFKQEDIRTWSLNGISDQIIKHYQYSFENADSSKRTSIAVFEDVLNNRKNQRHIRPTLYDFLAHRAIEFFQSTELDITKPAKTFKLDDPNFFGNANTFVGLKITSPDSMSTKYYATKILQNLTQFHLTDQDHDPTPFVVLELERLKFVRSKYVGDRKDSLYLEALERLRKSYEAHELSAEIDYEIAVFHSGLGDNYQAGKSDQYKWEKKTAMDICQKASTKFPKSYGAKQCESLMSRMKGKSLSFQVEEVTLPNAPFRALLTSKNVDKVYFRVIQLDWDKMSKKYLNNEELMKDYVKRTPIKKWEYEIPVDGDFQQHKVEVKIPELPLGYYAILVGTNEQMNFEKNAIAYSVLWASELSYTSRRHPDNSYEFTVLNRLTGKPMAGVKAQIFSREYDYKVRGYRIKKQELYTTNEKGTFKIPRQEKYRTINVDLTYKEDRLAGNRSFYQSRYYERNDNRITTHFFTDRGIYRPGQTVYFKGIMLESTNGENHKLKTAYTSTVTFYDVNRQKIEDVQVKTNEYGTFSGTFTAPVGMLNGQMHIENGYGSKYFSVEEYKRPKFEVKFEPVEGTYKLGQKIKVTGLAKAYAGSNIDGADVKYRITRTARFPYWLRYRYWGYYPSSASTEITNGEMKTDENGEFIVEFEAIPDLSISKKYYPTFSYSISADVVDINGETHSASQYVSVGYTAMNLSVKMPGKINTVKEQEFKVSTTNLNGQKVGAKGKITIHKLKEPTRLFRSRYWSKPDRHKMAEADYYTDFPSDLFDDELEKSKWEKEKQVWSSNFDTEKEEKFTIDKLKEWEQGTYVMEAKALDAFGEEVSEMKYITVYSENSTACPVNAMSWFQVVKQKGEPGEKAVFLVGTKAKDVQLLYEVEHKGKIVHSEWIKLNDEQKKLEFLIEEKHRGNFSVHLNFAQNSRRYSNSFVVAVPYTNKELDISFETFRNKLLPGQGEEWKLKIKGKKGELVAAEMLASMYDASLDAFSSNSFYMNIYRNFYTRLNWSAGYGFNDVNSNLYQRYWNNYKSYSTRYYDRINWFGYSTYYYPRRYYGKLAMTESGRSFDDGEGGEMEESNEIVLADVSEAEPDEDATAHANNRNENSETAQLIPGHSKEITGGDKNGDGNGKEVDLSAVKARTNLNETAFFFPELETNEKGEVIVKFTIPEALTRWKFMGLAHTKDLKIGRIEEEVVTQKDLMVMPNPPRFLRESDRIVFPAKISNISEEDLSGTAQLMLFDAVTMQPLDKQLGNAKAQRSFTAKKGQSTVVSWELNIPDGIQAVTYRIVAKAGDFSDGEEMALPVLTNRMLVTESLPLPVKGKTDKTFKFEKLLASGSSSTLKHHKLTLEYTSNPAWYAIQAMPYMMEYPYECAEQTFTRYYSNSIASHIVNSNPKIKRVFEAWKTTSPEAFLSNLEKNQELKALLLEETPWVLNAKDEQKRKQRVALLFDLNKMSNELSRALRKLEKAQVSNGGFPWFPGMPESRYITQHIVTGMGHLDNLGVKTIREDQRVWRMVKAGVGYLDKRIIEDYEYVKKHFPDYKEKKHIGSLQIQYLYARSYFKDIPIKGKLKEAMEYYQTQAKTYWLDFNLYLEGMIALSAHRFEMKTLATDIMKSLKERSIVHEEMGMYWKEMYSGYYWWQAPVETQSLLIEAFDEVTNDQVAVEEMKVWLLKEKQTTDWKTTKATAEACYALLLRGSDLLANDALVELSVGSQKIVYNKEASSKKEKSVKTEAGTGYFKTSWAGSDITADMGSVHVNKTTDGVAWGALYWQYFEQLDKITPHETPLKLDKKLFREKNTASGPVIEPVTEKSELKPGDKLKVRIELRVDRNMEYVHMKDMRASGFEPMNVISRYKWQDGLGYYESTRDAATNFFFEYLPKGTHVFEYNLRVAHEGDFSNGVTTIQCMYAPEFTSHSEGIRVKVGKQ